MTVGFQAFKNLLAIMQHARRGIELDGSVWRYARAVPAVRNRPVNVDHMVSEVVSKAWVGKDFFPVVAATGVLVGCYHEPRTGARYLLGHGCPFHCIERWAGEAEADPRRGAAA